MKKYIGLVCVLLVSVSCYQPERNCKDYKTGEFRFNYLVNGIEKTGNFKRDNHYSIDYHDGKIDSAKVKWVNDCEFILQDLKTKSSVHIKIMSTTPSSYTFEYGLVGEPIKKQGTAIKIN